MMASRSRIRGLFIVLLALAFPGLAWPADPSASPSQPEVWLCPGQRISELLEPGAEWPFVKRHLSGIKLYVDQINRATPEQLAAVVRLARENNYQIAVELGCCLDFGPMDDTNGEWSSRTELAKIEKLYSAGGKVDFLDLDGPVRRLMHPDRRRDGQRFESIEKAADEVVDSVRAFHEAHPEIRFWHLTNFPNWGYQGDVSYHARGPNRQDYGDYDEAHRLVSEKLRHAGIPLSGVTIDNPYEYLIGEHFSVNLKNPKSVNWLQRVRDYEDRARAEGLEVNLIVNSERGGHQSDELFHRETLEMVDTYLEAGGRPTRWIVQTWYPHPKQIVPETAPHSMTALAKAVIQRLKPELGAETESDPMTQAPSEDNTEDRRIVLEPHQETTTGSARVPDRDNATQPQDAESAKPHGRMEEMHPDALEKVLAEAPVAFVPLGTFEHHGWHLPVCFDGIKAHALCERVAAWTGGAVLPTFFYGTGGGHIGYKWTLMLPENQIKPIIEATLDHLAAQGFKVVVLLTGHYPKEQVDMVHRLAEEAQARHPGVRFIGLTEPEVTTAEPGDPASGDHAAKYETSIAMALNPAWVRIDALTAGRDPAAATLPATPRRDVPTHDPAHPLYAIYGQDPRAAASKELGEKIVAEIVSRLAAQVEDALNAAR